MFSNRTSRSHSFSSNKSADPNEKEDVRTPEPMDIDDPEMGQCPKESYLFTKNHPQGAALLRLVEDMTNLAKKSNVKSMSTNIGDFCSAFHNSIRLERDRTDNLIGNCNHDIEMSILNKELATHKYNTSIPPPQYFSPVPTITSTQKSIEVLKVFPRHAKFSGTNKDGGMGVVEFLRSLVAAQNQCGLSEEEFLDRLLASSTGQAHDLILEWRLNGMNSATVFYNLLLNYDKRTLPLEAKAQLLNYKAPRSGTLASAEAHIVKLMGRAASTYPAGPSRMTYYDHEGTSALINALPLDSSLIASQIYNKITAQMQRACTLLELSQGLNLHRDSIDRDIKMNGATTNKSPKFEKNNSF